MSEIERLREALETCPFCGGPAFVRERSHSMPLPITFQAQCGDCFCGTGDRYTAPEYAIAAWNCRAALAATPPGAEWKLVPVEPTPEMLAATLPLQQQPVTADDLRLAERAVALLEGPNFPADAHLKGRDAALDLIHDWRAMLKAATPGRGEWKAAPCEPTDAQVMAALEWGLQWMAQHGVDHLSPFEIYPNVGDTARGMYRAMLAAAPPPPASEGEK